jgi:hypothetical protein
MSFVFAFRLIYVHVSFLLIRSSAQIWSAILTMSLLILGAVPTLVLNSDGVYTVSTYYWQQVCD